MLKYSFMIVTDDCDCNGMSLYLLYKLLLYIIVIETAGIFNQDLVLKVLHFLPEFGPIVIEAKTFFFFILKYQE